MTPVPITADLNTAPKLIAYLAGLLRTAAPDAVTSIGGHHDLTVGITHGDGSETAFKVTVASSAPNVGWSL